MIIAVIDTAPVASSPALASNTATLVETNAVGGSKNIGALPSTLADIAEYTTDSVLYLCSLVLRNTPVVHPVSSAATHEKVT